ncbi:MAG: hypothetical protein PHG95_00475 [Patescibacteria group bacterium]|nr:hypothetical protein [Patescibacteria group bacterium]
MPIEYLPNIQVGGKIDLEPDRGPRLRPEKLLAFLKEKLSIRAAAYNKAYGQEWLDENACLRIPENHPDKESDQKLIDIQEQTYARESGKSVEKWREDKEKNPATLTEAALTLMLQRVLPDNFMVVRSSAYDDYNNGVDQLIIDRESGAVVCGIDEVIDRQGNTGPSKKEAKMQENRFSRYSNVKYGAQVKYGAKIEQGNLILGSLRDLPSFYLSINKEELALLGETLLKNEEVSDYERDLLKRLCHSLSMQLKDYFDFTLDKKLKIKLQDFLQSLETWL